MEQYLFPVIMIVVGVIFLTRNIIHFRNEEKLRSYLETSPKAKLWVKKFGIEKTMSLSKSIFLPFGSLVAAAMLGFGIWNMTILAQL
ncbi:MAG: hypothetical protein WBC60_07330 [Cognaticolwellia sp.]